MADWLIESFKEKWAFSQNQII